MSKTFICKGCKEKYDINMQSSNIGYCYICNEFYMKQQLAQTEVQNKRVLDKLELIVRSNQELEKALELACEFNATTTCNGQCQDCSHKEICDNTPKIDFRPIYADYFKEQAQKELKKDE